MFKKFLNILLTILTIGKQKGLFKEDQNAAPRNVNKDSF